MKRTDFSRTSWPVDEVSTLKQLAKELPPAEIALAMGRSDGAIRAKLFRLGLSAAEGKDWWSDDDVLYLEQNIETVPVADIAAHLKRSPASVKKKCWSLGISLRKNGYDEDDVRLAIELYRAGVSRKDISEKLEVSYGLVAGWIRQEGRNK